MAKQRNGATYLKKLKVEQLTSKTGRERFQQYAKYAVEAYLRGVKDTLEISQKELPTEIRSPHFYERVRDRVKSQYKKDSLGREAWLRIALPKLVV